MVWERDWLGKGIGLERGSTRSKRRGEVAAQPKARKGPQCHRIKNRGTRNDEVVSPRPIDSKTVSKLPDGFSPRLPTPLYMPYGQARTGVVSTLSRVIVVTCPLATSLGQMARQLATSLPQQ